MNILVLNSGSTSIKFKLFRFPEASVFVKGQIEKIGLTGSFMTLKTEERQLRFDGAISDHRCGIDFLLNALVDDRFSLMSSLSEIAAVGHRVVHGGEHFQQSTLITEEVLAQIESCIELAPLHNPANLQGIRAVQTCLPAVPQVAVFDTAFHQTMPAHAYMYAIPFSLYKKYGLRRYGFHGTSHRYVAQRACELLNRPMDQQRIISCHLGGGASIAAIERGKSIDTSMGLTPVEGMIMGTRSGDLDLGVLTFIMNKEDISVGAANALINKHSGMLGITGISSDMREIEEAAATGDARSQLALNMFRYRVLKYIGSYAAAMNGVDLVLFTGGIGENDPGVREGVCRQLGYLGVAFDTEANRTCNGCEGAITTPNSPTTVMVIPTNEELAIARDTFALIS
jgi:acetate kinase